MKPWWRRLMCFFGLHSWKQQPTGAFVRLKCEHCEDEMVMEYQE